MIKINQIVANERISIILAVAPVVIRFLINIGNKGNDKPLNVPIMALVKKGFLCMKYNLRRFDLKNFLIFSNIPLSSAVSFVIKSQTLSGAK